MLALIFSQFAPTATDLENLTFFGELVILLSLAFYGAYTALENLGAWAERKAHRNVLSFEAKRRERALAAIAGGAGERRP